MYLVLENTIDSFMGNRTRHFSLFYDIDSLIKKRSGKWIILCSTCRWCDCVTVWQGTWLYSQHVEPLTSCPVGILWRSCGFGRQRDGPCQSPAGWLHRTGCRDDPWEKENRFNLCNLSEPKHQVAVSETGHKLKRSLCWGKEDLYVWCERKQTHDGQDCKYPCQQKLVCGHEIMVMRSLQEICTFLANLQAQISKLVSKKEGTEVLNFRSLFIDLVCVWSRVLLMEINAVCLNDALLNNPLYCDFRATIKTPSSNLSSHLHRCNGWENILKKKRRIPATKGQWQKHSI